MTETINQKTDSMLNDAIQHKIKELEQEKVILEAMNDYLNKDKISSDELMASLQDRLKNPITPVKAYVDMLMNGHFGDLNVAQREKMELINKSIRQLDKNIDETIKRKKYNS